MEPTELPDYYETLQVSRTAQPFIINKAYRLLAAVYHPDNRETGNQEAFRLVLEANRMLSDPMRRAAYDRERFGAPQAPRTGSVDPDLSVAAESRALDERELRDLLLQALYNTRRGDPGRPSLTLMAIPELFGCSIDEAQFTLWYLRGKKFIEMTDEGMAITVAGVDYVEATHIDSPSEAELRSLAAPRYMIGVGDRARNVPYGGVAEGTS
jgi:curved DNA-binding protein